MIELNTEQALWIYSYLDRDGLPDKDTDDRFEQIRMSIFKQIDLALDFFEENGKGR